MTEPTRPRPVPGPPRPGPEPAGAPRPAGAPGAVPRPGTAEQPGPTGPAVPQPFADLPQRPVSEHVAVFEAEHARLQRELGTIDQL